MRKNSVRCCLSFLTASRHEIYLRRTSHPVHVQLLQQPIIATAVTVVKASELKHPFSGSNSIARRTPCASFSSTTETQGDAEERGSESDSSDEAISSESAGDPGDLETVVDILRTVGAQERSKRLEQCSVAVTPALVSDVLSSTRNDWEAAFTFFLWAGKQPGYSHSLREYHSMIAILGKFRKFDTAWTLIDEMRGACILTPHTLLIMIRKYAAVHDVGKTINTFYAHRRFKFQLGMDEFQGLLSALCRYKNVKDAEHLLFCNRDVFPLNTKSFNIILNGWCNVVGDLKEGKRIWKEMEVRGIKYDVYSYSSIMSSYSKLNYLQMVLKLYERMKGLGMKPDRKVYNAVIHALAKGRLVREARNLMETMEQEGLCPDAVTYNSFIMPLCKSRLLDEAKQAFDEMMERGLLPTVRTYHAFFRILRTGEEVFELLQRMREAGCNPSHDTYIMLIRKFCRWRQVETVFNLWNEMSKNGLDPDRSSYAVLIHGLFLNGRLTEAHKYYLEMKEKHLLPEPKIDAVLQLWLEGKKGEDQHVIACKGKQHTSGDLGERVRVKSREDYRKNDFLPRPELRNVTRERGFSFWKN